MKTNTHMQYLFTAARVTEKRTTVNETCIKRLNKQQKNSFRSLKNSPESPPREFLDNVS